MSYSSSFYISFHNLTLTESRGGITINSFNLKEISKNELRLYRNEGVPSFVLKINNHLYWCEISFSTRMMSQPVYGLSKKIHLCGESCEHLLPSICPKVFSQEGIENFAFIHKGYETFNTKQDCFVVLECSCFKKQLPKPVGLKQKNELRLALADFMWPNDDNLTFQKIRKQTERNLAKLRKNNEE